MRFLHTVLIGLTALSASLGSAAVKAPTELETQNIPLSATIKPGDRVDRIRFLGMLQLPNPTVDGMRFSQLSGLAWDDDDNILYAISDKGFLFHLRPEFENGMLTGLKLLKAVRLRELGSNKPLGYGRTDSEGLDILKGRNGRQGDAELLISFERFPRIVRYRPDGYAVSEYTLPAPLNEAKRYQDPNKMLESVCEDPQLGILTVPEVPLRGEREGYTRIFSVEGGSWFYPLPQGNRITDLACLGHGRVMVLESDFRGAFGGLAIYLRIADLPPKPNPASPEPVPVATMASLDTRKGHQLDNFEGLTRHRGHRFFMVSDDNDLFIQRSLLMYFEVPDEK
ncbi:MAG: esterase-like activity of phytase family protein [Sulfuricaulis sp.]